IPEQEVDPEALVEAIRSGYERGKRHALIVVAEGATLNAQRLIAYFNEHHSRVGFELRATILGHVQRGGSPTAFDRLLATRLGVAGIESIVAGQVGVLMGLKGDRVASTPLEEVASKLKKLDLSLLDTARMLAR